MDGDSRTIYCGNLSSKCTEEILYELFLQAGPLEKVNIPKDRDGNIKTFGFITYKHQVSVPYAVELFEGTNLYNRPVTIKPRQSEQNQATNNLQQQQQQNVNEILQYGNQVLMGYQMPNFGFNMNMSMNMMPMYMKPPGLIDYPSSQVDTFSHSKDRHSSARSHPYSRERERHRDRNRHRDRDHERGNNYQQNQRDNRNHRSNHHRSGRSYR